MPEQTEKPIVEKPADKKSLRKPKQTDKKCRALEVGHRTCDCGREGCGRPGTN